MKREEVLAAIADLVGADLARRQAAIGALEALPQGFLEDHPLPKKKVAPYLSRLAQLLGADVSPTVKRWCAQLVGESGIRSPELLDSLRGSLGASDAGFLATVLWAIGEYGPQGLPAVDAVAHHTANPDREVRWRAVWALGQMGLKGQSYAEMFAKLFDDNDGLVRGYAVLGFVAAATPSPWAVAQLQRAAKDQDEMPRGHAQHTLEKWMGEGRS